MKSEYIERIKALAVDIGSVVNLGQSEYERKIRKLIFQMPVDEIGVDETIFLLCKGIKDEIEGA